jgi:hypothetical protein
MASGLLPFLGKTINKIGSTICNAVSNFGSTTPNFSPNNFVNAINNSPQVTGLMAPKTSVGVQAKAPTTAAPNTTLPANQVSTAPKQTTQSSTDGGTNSSATTTPVAGSTFYDPKTGKPAGTNQFDPVTGKALANPNVTNVTGQPAPQNLGLYGTLINQATQSTANNKAITDNTQKQVDQTTADIANLRQGAATQESAYQTGMTVPRAQGLAQNIASTEANLETNLQGKLNNELAAGTQELTGQGQTQSGLLSAAGLAAPNGNIINVDPTTGLPVAGGSLAQLANTAGTVQGIQSGAAANAAAGGNIAAQNATALGTASTGANAKSIGDFTNQINTTQKSVTTLNNLADQIVPNMSSTGFNPTSSPIGNQTFAQYFTEKNPAAKAGIVAGLGEIKNQISNVIASATGLTPSGVTAVTDTYDLTTLNPQQLHDFLGYINQYAQSNLDAAQKSIQTIQSGGTVSANPAPLPVPAANSTGQAVAGTGAGLASQLIGKIVSEAGNAVAGTIGGYASSILK